MNTKSKKLKLRNFVAKFVQRSGAGKHADKRGKHASRAKQKRAWKRELSNHS